MGFQYFLFFLEFTNFYQKILKIYTNFKTSQLFLKFWRSEQMFFLQFFEILLLFAKFFAGSRKFQILAGNMKKSYIILYIFIGFLRFNKYQISVNKGTNQLNMLFNNRFRLKKQVGLVKLTEPFLLVTFMNMQWKIVVIIKCMFFL